MEDTAAPASEQERKHGRHGGLVVLLVLALVIAVAASVLGVYSTVRAEQLSERLESLESRQALNELAIRTFTMGPSDVQGWLDTGQVRVRIEIDTPLGCFAGDYVRWDPLEGDVELSC